MSDLNLLRVLMNRKQFKSSASAVPHEQYDSNTVAMLKWFKYYFDSYPEHDKINVDELSSLIRLKAKLSNESMALMNELLKQLRTPIPEDVRATTLNALEERRIGGEIEMLIQQWNDGQEIDLIYELHKRATEARERIQLQSEGAWCDTDVWELIQADADDAGYILDFLPVNFYKNIKGITEGKNICIAAPTDKGKTSFLCRVAVSFAKQRKKLMEESLALYGQDDENADPSKVVEFRPVVYLVNEGQAEVITPRIYATALEYNREQLWQAGKDGRVTKEFIEVLGRRDAIRLVNIHGKSISQVARIIEAHNPFCVISDMTGRIRSNSGGKGANDIAQLEEVWDDMRVLAAMYNFIHVGTAQISAEGFDNLYPPLSALQNSKTGIQTTLDLAVWLGAYSNATPENERMRGISTPKNKLVRSGCKSYNTDVAYFDPESNTWDEV